MDWLVAMLRAAGDPTRLRLLLLLRQGKISKWFSGMGQEAISVGTALAMDKEEFILPGV